MALRIGFDMDGVLADFSTAYHQVEERLFGTTDEPTRAGDPEDEQTGPPEDGSKREDASKGEEGNQGGDGSRGEEAAQRPVKPTGPRSREMRRRRDAVWRAIHDTPDFWCSLAPVDPGAVRRIHALMLQHRWELFFITQRPATLGDTVQRQTQRWLVEQGFDLPSVLVIPGSRGAAAAALRLNYHVDDSARNCLDVKSESSARPLLILSEPDEAMTTSARRLGIGTAASITDALAILEEATRSETQPTLLHRLAQLVGWD